MMRSTQRGSSPNNPPVTTKSAASQRVPRRRDIAHQLKALVQLAPDATVVVDGGGRIRLVNLQTEELFGYSSDELLGQPVELLVPERLWAVHQQHRAMYASAPYVRPMGASLPLSGRRRDGSEFSIEASLGPLDEGDESLVIVSIRDITERKRLEQMLAERVAQLEAVMEAVPEVLTVYNAAGRIVLSNTAHHARLARFYPQTLPGETVRERIVQLGGAYDAKGGELEEAEWPLTRVLRGEVLTGTNAVELTLRTPQNELATFNVSGAPLYNADSKIIGAVTVSHDITEQKRLAREREEARAHELALEDTARHMDEFLATASQ